MITRGFIDSDGSRRWTKFVTVPDDRELLGFLAETLRAAAETAAPK